VFFQTSPSLRGRLLAEILKLVEEAGSSGYFADLAAACIMRGREYSRTTVKTWVEHLATTLALEELPTGIAESFEADHELLLTLAYRFSGYHTAGNRKGSQTCATFICQTSDQGILQLAQEFISSGDLDTLAMVVRIMLKHRLESVPLLFSKHLTNGQVDLLCRTALERLGEFDKGWWLEILRHLTEQRIGSLQRLVRESDSSVAHEIDSLIEQELLMGEILKLLRRHFGQSTPIRKSNRSDETVVLNEPGTIDAEIVFLQDFTIATQASDTEKTFTRLKLIDKVRSNPFKRLVVDSTTVLVYEKLK